MVSDVLVVATCVVVVAGASVVVGTSVVLEVASSSEASAPEHADITRATTARVHAHLGLLISIPSPRTNAERQVATSISAPSQRNESIRLASDSSVVARLVEPGASAPRRERWPFCSRKPSPSPLAPVPPAHLERKERAAMRNRGAPLYRRRVYLAHGFAGQPREIGVPCYPYSGITPSVAAPAIALARESTPSLE